MFEMDLGVDFSIQVVSRRLDAIFWLSVSLFLGVMQCMMVGKTLSMWRMIWC
jgi:hypothetical protein